MVSPLRWFSRNLGTLILAFVLALVVWVSAVIADDPNEERVYPRSVTLEVIGLDPSMLIVNNLPSQVRMTLNAPRSVWEQLNDRPDLLRTWIDISGLEKGEYTIAVRHQVNLKLVRVIKLDPQEVEVNIEPLLTNAFPVELNVTGDPALGYRKGAPLIEPSQVSIAGPESLVSTVEGVTVNLSVSGANETVRRSFVVQALNAHGEPVQGITIAPQSVSVTQPINLLGGYRNVVVKVVTNGGVAEGYWLTNISVTPPNVTVFSTNPGLVNELPGFVETLPINLDGLSDDTDIRASLQLPEGVTLAGEESVLVRLSIAARDGSLPINLPVEAVGLSPELDAVFSPDSVEVMLSGPLPILNNLNPAGIRVSVNLSGLELGIHQVEPVVDLLPSQVRVVYILPATLEVTIRLTPTPTSTSSTPSPFSASGTLTPQPAVTLLP